jgi:1-acyl-sn-glycerol-3-phosphate acyltransferase
VAARGKSLAFFPEGTFRRSAGLLPFRSGAFVTAAAAGVPVLPVAIRGSRALLRARQWLPRRGALVVTIGAPIPPPTAASGPFAAAIELRAAARAVILRECGEPELLEAESELPVDRDQRSLSPGVPRTGAAGSTRCKTGAAHGVDHENEPAAPAGTVRQRFATRSRCS